MIKIFRWSWSRVGGSAYCVPCFTSYGELC